MEIIGIGDRITGPFKRGKKRWKAAKHKTRQKITLTSRKASNDRVTTTHKGHQKVTLTPAMRKAMRAKRPAGRKTQTGSEVRGQKTSTASRTGRCGTCKGVYSLIKGGRLHAHDILETGRPCPGGGRPPKAGRPKTAAQRLPQRTATPTPATTVRGNYCAACGQPGTRGNPLARVDGARIHRSHLNDPKSGYHRAAPPSRPAARRMPQEATAEQISPDRKRMVVDAVRAEFAADKVDAHEIFLAANGEIWIDRRGRDPRNVPFAAGRWKPA